MMRSRLLTIRNRTYFVFWKGNGRSGLRKDGKVALNRQNPEKRRRN
ncbi:unnamed protein product [Strongylus vulgaris]|uniref:Uncharacterized protein n=1 Tax=Strongylus vulgaris TaxID=40348 RepID=A0A3P7ISH1_STRVU|nr:unnamed protein product [Strongylus vulgaris]